MSGEHFCAIETSEKLFFRWDFFKEYLLIQENRFEAVSERFRTLKVLKNPIMGSSKPRKSSNLALERCATAELQT